MTNFSWISYSDSTIVTKCSLWRDCWGVRFSLPEVWLFESLSLPESSSFSSIFYGFSVSWEDYSCVWEVETIWGFFRAALVVSWDRISEEFFSLVLMCIVWGSVESCSNLGKFEFARPALDKSDAFKIISDGRNSFWTYDGFNWLIKVSLGDINIFDSVYLEDTACSMPD